MFQYMHIVTWFQTGDIHHTNGAPNETSGLAAECQATTLLFCDIWCKIFFTLACPITPNTWLPCVYCVALRMIIMNNWMYGVKPRLMWKSLNYVCSRSHSVIRNFCSNIAFQISLIYVERANLSKPHNRHLMVRAPRTIFIEQILKCLARIAIYANH